MQQYILGVDIGTGSVKAVAVGTNGAAIASAQQHYAEIHPQPGFAEQDVETIWKGFLQCIREITGKLGQPACISLSSAMHSLVLVDENGKCLSNMINWADIRSAEIAEKLRFTAEGKALYQACGTPVYSMSPLTKIMWFKQNKPDLFNRTARFVSIKEVFWYRLFGVFEVDYSIASATGMFDITAFCWSKTALQTAGVGAEKLSKPIDTTFTRNDADEQISASVNLKKDTLWMIGANDGCLANLGTQANRPKTAALTIGTSGAVRVAGSKPVFNNDAMVFNYLLDKKTYISGGAINNGGLVLNWLLEGFMAIKTASAKDYDQLFKTIADVEPGSGLLFLPYLTGERTPLWDSNSCGVFFGIKTVHQQRHFLKAALEGVCYTIRHVFELVVAQPDSIDALMISGGFTASPVWMQLMADVLGKKLIVAQAEDASAVGAVLLAIQTGRFEAFKLPAENPQEQIINPNPKNHEIYSKYYPLFVGLYQSLKDDMHRLAALNAPAH